MSWINDFKAQALASIELTDIDIVTIKAGIYQPDRLRLVIGPGTGLGVCGLIRSSEGWIPVSTQGGHSDLAPTTSLEIEILTLLQKKFGRVAVERVLSGPGIVNLYEALCEINGKDILFHSPSEITAAATNSNPDHLSKEIITRAINYIKEKNDEDIKIINKKIQTITYFGFEKEQFLNLINNNNRIIDNREAEYLNFKNLLYSFRALKIFLSLEGYL